MADKEALKKRLEELEEEYSHTKYNKATNKHLGILRAKMAVIKEQMEKKGGKKGLGFSVRKSGNATVCMVGFPNAGKSSTLKALTGVESKVASYAFTTLDVVPGTLNYNGAKIQVFDLPGIVVGAHIGKGRGTEVISVMRSADLILFIVDINTYRDLFAILDELRLAKIRINARKPVIRLEKSVSGGVSVSAGPGRVPSKEEIIPALNAQKIYNANVYLNGDCSLEEFEDFLLGRVVYVDALAVLNKIDQKGSGEVNAIKSEIEKKTGINVVPISAEYESNIDLLRDSVFKSLRLIRIYLRPKGGAPDFEKPIVMADGSTLADTARKLNSKTAKNAACGYVTGPSAKFENQRMGLEHVLMDGDVVTIAYRK